MLCGRYFNAAAEDCSAKVNIFRASPGPCTGNDACVLDNTTLYGPPGTVYKKEVCDV